MASSAKSKLKAARDALGKKDFSTARDAALQVLEYEEDNYNANVFLAVAYLELKENVKSEQAYKKAIQLNSEQPLAWQGIAKFYERVGDWDQYAETLERLAGIYARSEDAAKCGETVQKFIDLRRDRGTRSQLVDALLLLLPDSPLFSTLSALPPPDPGNPTATPTQEVQAAIHDSLPIIQEIVSLVEKEEEHAFKREFDKRRTRLDAPPPEQLKKEIGIEIWSTSKLPKLYEEVLNHPKTSDEVRRETDAKLLRNKQRYLHALPNTGEHGKVKRKVAKELQELVNGAVLLRISDELAWSIYLDGKDVDTIKGYDLRTLQQFIELFPTVALTRLLVAYFKYMNIQTENGDEKKIEKPASDDSEDAYDLIMDAFSSLSESIIAHQAVCSVYLKELDYKKVIAVAESGLELVHRSEQDSGHHLIHVRKAFNLALATSLVHYYPPKHHQRALSILDEVLSVDGNNIQALMGRGYIFQEAGNWKDAAIFFSKAALLAPRSPCNQDSGSRALEEEAWCRIQLHEFESGKEQLRIVLGSLEEGAGEDRARCLWRLGKASWDQGEKRKEAYTYFISALKEDPKYAPAFTSLGIHYLEFANPSDPVRASKCFQKAFELDAREADAARRLAEGFAEEREWDLVEIVARRTIDGEGGLEGGLETGEGAVGGRYLPKNGWAWKALGIAELTRRNYSPAIQALQVALRADKTDQLCWVRLGEAYIKAGRHVAASKALTRGLELDPSDWICSYFVGEVHRQMGLLPEAVSSFKNILRARPSEICILVSLGQTLLDLGREEFTTGFYSRAEQSFVECVHIALKTIEVAPGFRDVPWKIVGDALFFLSRLSSFNDDEAVRAALSQVASLIPGGSIRTSISLSSTLSSSALKGIEVLEFTVAAYDTRLSLELLDSTARASAWFDLGMALQFLAMKSLATEKQETASKEATQCMMKALREEPGDDTYWNALGGLHFKNHPKTAQHAYIRALEIDSKNVVTWTNLGLLYFHYGDFELANEALYRAQTLDPDYSLAWLGQGLVATANGHLSDARTVFEHAVSLPTNLPEVDLEYGQRAFKTLHEKTHNHSGRDEILLPVFFALGRYCKRRPADSTGLHLLGLVCERIGLFEYGAELIGQAIGILEAIYEETEDAAVERQFVIANSSLGRIRLALEDYAGAIESFEGAMNLLGEEGTDSESKILRVQAQFGTGLAKLKSGELEEALVLFEAALEAGTGVADVKGHVTVLLAQSLWALGSEESRDLAKGHLLEFLSADPENLMVINTLAGMGILAEDASLVDAALSEILALPVEHQREVDSRGDIDYLRIQHHLEQDDIDGAVAVAQRTLFTSPSRSEARLQLATLKAQRNESESALALLPEDSPSVNTDTLHESLILRAASECQVTGQKDPSSPKRLAQKAVMLRPALDRGWQVLAFAVSKIGQE